MRTHPLFEVSASLDRLVESLNECRSMLPGRSPKEDAAPRASAKAQAEKKAIECCRDLQNAPASLIDALNGIIAAKEYWGIAAAIMVFGDVAKKMRVHLTKAWVAKDPLTFFVNKPPHAFLDARRSSTEWSV